MEWICEKHLPDDFSFEPPDEEEPFETFIWDHEARGRTESKSLEDILQTENEASVVLVAIPSGDTSYIGATREVIHRLLDHFGIDRRALALFANFRIGISTQTTSAFSACHAATEHEIALWVHDISRRRLRAVLFESKAFPSLGNLSEILELELTKRRILESPALFPYAFLTSGLVWLRQLTYQGIDLARQLERMTGHSYSVSLQASIAIDSSSLPGASKKAAMLLLQSNRVLMDLADYQAAVHELLHMMNGEEVVQHPPATDEGILKTTATMKESLKLILKFSEACATDLKYVMKSAELQMTLIQSLISHQEAETSNKLAKANADQADASYRIAEQARQDAASMKTIAIMTMAFLPGTYIAALFAIPSLSPDQDGSQSTVQTNFAYYWAITLPVTAAILATWYMLNRTGEQRLAELRLKHWVGSKWPKKSAKVQADLTASFPSSVTSRTPTSSTYSSATSPRLPTISTSSFSHIPRPSTAMTYPPNQVPRPSTARTYPPNHTSRLPTGRL